MAKLHFKYGAMNAGKTTMLLQTAYNYEERGQKVLLLKPKIDTKGNDNVVSRLNIKRKVDVLLEMDDSVIDIVLSLNESINCILVDEAQFLTTLQVDELLYIAKIYNIPVIAFGLRTTFQMEGFSGSIRLLEVADELEELPTICSCGKKARFNGRKINGEYTNIGSEVLIDNQENIEYEALCGKCYLKKVLKK